MRMVFAAVVSALLVSPALANFYTLQEWAALTPAARDNYIAGAFDSMITVGTGEESDTAAVHYRACIKSARMSLSQLSANVLHFAQAKPEVQTGPVQTALVRYLISACGEPTPR